MSLPAFLLLKYILLVKFLYYIRNKNKYKRKTERVNFILGEKKTLHENTHTGFYSLASLFICYR